MSIVEHPRFLIAVTIQKLVKSRRKIVILMAWLLVVYTRDYASSRYFSMLADDQAANRRLSDYI